tara:strand:- start:107 stop:367 length:261 start_codon:yes stop_codon:yes gene_type:complete
LHSISSKSEYSFVIVGNDSRKGEIPQDIVKGGDWFAAEVIEPNAYAFVGCTRSPEFDFADFVLPKATELCLLFPQHSEIINQLTHQ